MINMIKYYYIHHIMFITMHSPFLLNTYYAISFHQTCCKEGKGNTRDIGIKSVVMLGGPEAGDGLRQGYGLGYMG